MDDRGLATHAVIRPRLRFDPSFAQRSIRRRQRRMMGGLTGGAIAGPIEVCSRSADIGAGEFNGDGPGRGPGGGGPKAAPGIPAGTGRWALLSLQFRQHDEFVDVAELTIEHVGGAGHHYGLRSAPCRSVDSFGLYGEAEDWLSSRRPRPAITPVAKVVSESLTPGAVTVTRCAHARREAAYWRACRWSWEACQAVV